MFLNDSLFWMVRVSKFNNSFLSVLVKKTRLKSGNMGIKQPVQMRLFSVKKEGGGTFAVKKDFVNLQKVCMMQVVKNTVSLLFSICLIVGLMPTLAFAEDEVSNGSADSQCVCEVQCADGSVNTDCPVCGSDGADLTKCLGSNTKDEVQDVQNQIDALPSVEELQAMSQDEQKQIYTKLQAANDAYNALSDDEKANITGSEALSNLFSFFNSGNVSTLGTTTEVTYLDENGDTKTANATVVDENSTSWSEGWYVVDGDVTINDRVSTMGNVNLILKDGCKFTAKRGIGLQPDSNISIYGQGEGSGELSIDSCAFGNAGIGSNNGGSCGDITINGGCVDVRGGTDAAGIGSGYSLSTCGQITINGGNVFATAGDGGSGIGSGYNSSSCLGISINGGSVFAAGGTNASGIGGGYCSGCGPIDIKGGIVTATGGGYGSAGIGGGYFSSSSCGAITIEGGTVTATGGTNASGIGSGKLNTEDVKFSTGDNGHAVIFASSISDQSNKDNWSGVIFIGNDGSIYGTTVAPTESFTIPEDKTLTIDLGKTLQINEGVAVTNNGKINVDDGGTYSGSQPASNPINYRVSILSNQDALTVEYVDGNNEGYASHGSGLQFKININQYYYKTDSFEVKANDQKLDANAEGVYTVQNITSPTSITIDGVEKDDAAPVLSGIENGKTYCEPVEASVDETNLAKVTINGVETTVNDGKFTVNPAAGEQTIAATDKAGNTTTCTITVNDGHTYVDGKCSVCGAVDPTYTVEVTAGANSTWKKGSKEGLSFTSNAAYSYFQKVQIDGNDVDQSNYTVQEGSTIVSLNAAYLETLPVGKHTIAIVSDTGTATTEFTIVAAQENEGPVTNNHPDNPNDQLGNTNNQPNNGSSDTNPALPKTGDPVNMALVITLALVAAAALAAAIMSIVVRIRRTKNKLH